MKKAAARKLAKAAPAKRAAAAARPVVAESAPRKAPIGTLHQTLSFAAAPAKIYAALLDSEQHSAFTGAPAHVEPRVGSKFNAWDGYIHGVIMELDAPRRIVQSWRATDFPQGHPVSRLEISLESDGKGGTTLELNHSGLPAATVEGYDKGWHDFYWQPLRDWLAAGS